MENKISSDVSQIVDSYRGMSRYYPTAYGNNPIHPVMDWDKVASIMQAAIDGVDVPHILIDGRWDSNQVTDGNMITGTHRAAAHELLIDAGMDDVASRIETDCIWDAIGRLEGSVAEEARDAMANNDYEAINNIFDI